MIKQLFKRFNNSIARPTIMVVVAASLVLSSVSIAFAVATANVPIAAAALPVLAGSTQFDVTGFLQSATVNNPADPHSGGTMMLNGQTIIVPAETIVILPASALTWQELFAMSPAPYTGVATGMALADVPTPHTTYEVQAVGNHVIAGGQDRYIAGMVHVTQQGLNAGAGYINFINYTDGSFEVGGQIGVAGTGSVVRINDPANATSASGGRYGRAFTPDVRFQVDQDNPTIASAQGFPMCIPRVTADPNIAGNVDDPLCPLTNRPISTGLKDPVTGQQHPPAGQFDSFFTMNAPLAVLPGQTQALDPRIQAPMEVGDFVNTSGTLTQGVNGDYIAAHTVVNDTAIFTQPGIDPAYVSIEVALIGTGGLTVFGAGEAAVRTKFEGMTTDPSRNIHLYGIDINPATGATSDRDWGTIGIDPGPPLLGAVKGRWRFRPPCTVTVATQKSCTPPPAGTFLPPTREVRAVIEGLQTQNPQSPTAITSANGIFYGQYHAPIGEYIFPENVPGQPIPENNFNSIDFLAYGGYQSITGVQAGVLNPWPSNVPPVALVAATPTILGAPYSVANGGIINLSGSINANASSPVTLLWTAGTTAGGTDLNGALTGASTTTPSFNANGLAAATYFLSFSASNVLGTQTANTTIKVQAAPKPTINPILNQTVNLGSAAASPVTIVATSASLPAPKFAWVKTSGPAVVSPTQTPSAATATPTSTFRFTPSGAGVYVYSVTATNANGTSSASTVTITVTAAETTNIALTTEYRTGKQRLVIAATTTDLTVTSMVLQPYMLENGTMFNPAGLGASFTNAGGGLWNITIVGALPPACNFNAANYATPCSQAPLIVKSTGGAAGPGTSVYTALQKIRQ